MRLKGLLPFGHPHIEYSNILADPSRTDAEGLELLAQTVRNIKGIDFFSLPKVPHSTMLAKISTRLGERAPVDEVASIFNLSEITEFEQTQQDLSKSGRKRRKQRRNKLAKQGNISFQSCWADQEGFADLVIRAFAMKRDWLEQTSRNDSKFTIDGYEDCIKALPGDHQQHEGAVATFLSVDNKPVAIEIGFARKGHYYAYIGAFDWGWRDFSVGKIQMEETLSWAVDVALANMICWPSPPTIRTAGQTCRSICPRLFKREPLRANC